MVDHVHMRERLYHAVIDRMVEAEGLGFPLTSRVPHGTMYIGTKPEMVIV